MRGLRNLPIRSKLRLFGVALAVCVLAQAVLGVLIGARLRVPGPVYQELLEAEVLVSDVLPPPKYIVETHLMAHRLVDAVRHASSEVEPLIERLGELERQFEERSAYWPTRALPEPLARAVGTESTDPARAYYTLVRERLLPAARAGDADACSELVEGELDALYLAHRIAIDDVVRLARAKRSEAEERAASLAARSDQLLWGTTGLVLLGGLALTLALARQLSQPLRRTAEAMQAVAENRKGHVSLDVARGDEIGEIARGLDALVRQLRKREEEANRRAEEAEAARRDALRIARQLKENRERLSLAIDVAGLAMWEYEPANAIVRVDARLAELLGRPLDSLPQAPEAWADLIHPEDYANNARAMQAHLEGRAPAFVSQWRGRHADGSWVWIASVGRVVVRDEQARPVRLLGTHQDITAQRAQEDELLRAKDAAESASRAKSEFLANMSHEIRTPLTAIMGSAELLRDDGDIQRAPVRRVETIEAIHRSGEHLLCIINDILDISKIEAGELRIHRAGTDPIAVLREVVSICRARAVQKHITLDVVFDTPVPQTLTSDATRLRQILMNLVGNAIKFTKEGGVRIACALEESGGGAFAMQFDIVDTGIGMTAAQVDGLFRPFAQADSSMSREFGGTGLGLAISRRLARMLGGDVTILRSEVGQGSTFRVRVDAGDVSGVVRISAYSEEAHDATPTQPAEVRLCGRILLAEDGVDNQRLISHHLRKAGAEVDVADNGRSAIDKVDTAQREGRPYDLILMDMQMPHVDGYTAARTLKATGSTVPIIALTAHALPEDRAKCLDAGCCDYATKPINRVKLLTTVQQWLGAEPRTSRQAA